MKVSIGLIALFAFINSFGQKSKNDFKTVAHIKTKVDSIFKDFDKKNTPGYAIGILKDNEILYNRGYGSANLDYDIPITSTSSFDVASVSKQFTAACIALLIMDGKVSLETPASNFVPEVTKYKDTIRIKHLLYNTSGITDYYKLPRPDGRSWITFNYFDIDYCIQVSLHQDTLAFTPGYKWDYCNVNYMLLTKIVEKISGQSFRQFAKHKLFEPLGMTSTFINDDVTQIIKKRVTPYNKRTPENVAAYKALGIAINSDGEWLQHNRNSPHYGGSGVVTTVNDLIIWSKNFFSKKFGGNSFYNWMHHTEVFPHGRNNQAFGLYTGKYKGSVYVAWDGGDYGISTQLIRFVDKKVAIVVLSNLGSGEAYKKANAIADILMEHGVL